MNVSGKYLKDESGDTFSPITSVDTIFKGNIKLLDLIYPVGSYYETSDSDFNPNESWGGTWVEDTDGAVLIAQGKNYGGKLATPGQTIGQDDFQLQIGQIPGHTHTYQKSNATSGSHTLTINEMPKHQHLVTSNNSAVLLSDLNNWQKLGSGSVNVGRSELWNGTSDVGGSQGHTHPINFISTNTGSAGASTSNQSRVSVVQKSKVVCRWHRTA